MTVRLKRRRLFKQRRFRQLIIALVILALWLGMLIVVVEQTSPASPIQTWFDGFYWSVTTLTTVGYGDYVPVTLAGKWIAVLLQLVGAMMFGLVIAIISSYVNRYQDEFYWNRLFDRLNRIEDEIKDLQRRSDYLVKKEHEDDQDQAKRSTDSESKK